MNECEVTYTVQRMTPEGKFYGAVHGTDDVGETVCGTTIDEHWYVLTNDWDGTITCKKCIEHNKMD